LDGGGVVVEQAAPLGVGVGAQSGHLGGRLLAARSRRRQLRRQLLYPLLVLDLQLARLGANLRLVRYLPVGAIDIEYTGLQ